VQYSTASQSRALTLQIVDDDLKTSVGQVLLEPLQFSATSQTPAEARHTVDDDLKTSVGQVLLTPLQYSAVSHNPFATRQTEVNFPSAGHKYEFPLHTSATSQTPAEARHTVDVVKFSSLGHTAELPVQYSDAPQTPPAVLQTVDAKLNTASHFPDELQTPEAQSLLNREQSALVVHSVIATHPVPLIHSSPAPHVDKFALS